MEKETLKCNNNNNVDTNTNNIITTTHKIGSDGLLRTSLGITRQTNPDFVLQWGNRKRLRCMKVQLKDDSSARVHRTAVRVDRRVVRADKDTLNLPTTTTTNFNNYNHGIGYLNLRQRASWLTASPSSSHRVLRNSENSSAMRGQSNGGVRRLASPDDRGAHDKRASNNNDPHPHPHYNNNHNENCNNKSALSSETAHDSKKGGGGSSSGSGEAAAAPPAWPPKFVIALTNKEKEEDFIAFKGSKLPQRPKKRAKFIQRTLNLVSPGAWLCDLTLERYEVREKKISKKRPRGLKAMGNMDSDSE